MEALTAIHPTLGFEIFTTVPRWFFEDSLRAGFRFHEVPTDIGLVQSTPLKVDLPATVKGLDRFFPLDGPGISQLAGRISRAECRLILCDIAPMGIEVARKAGIPSILMENFTWDWIYAGYVKDTGALERHIPYLNDLFLRADYHIQTRPVCNRGSAHLTTFPVSRKARTPRREIRRALGIGEGAKLIMMTMGGIRTDYPFLERLRAASGIRFVVPGASKRMEIRDNLILLPHHSDFYHPDLVRASDAVLGKVGYSTLAECYEAGVPFGYFERPGFRESPELVSFIETEMKGLCLGADDFSTGTWISRLPDLLALPRSAPNGPRGADQAARFILEAL